MRNILHEYDRVLTDLSRTAKMYEVLESLASTEANIFSKQLDEALLQGGGLREFEYAGIIITLYGAFERLMEGLLREAIELQLENTSQYADLPAPIKNAYQARACELIGGLRDAHESDSLNELASVISSLNSCLNNHRPYKLLVEPMLAHTSNFRKKTVNKFFQSLALTYYDVHDISAIAERERRLRKTVTEHYGQTIEELSSNSFFAVLDDLVARRNRVAHGQREENRLGRKEVLRYIKYMSVLGIVLYDSVICPMQSRLLGTRLGTPYRILGDGAVACIEVCIPIRVGQLVVVCRGDNTWFGATITAIQVNKVSLEFLEPETPVRAGVEVDVPLMTKSCGVYTL